LTLLSPRLYSSLVVADLPPDALVVANKSPGATLDEMHLAVLLPLVASDLFPVATAMSMAMMGISVGAAASNHSAPGSYAQAQITALDHHACGGSQSNF